MADPTTRGRRPVDALSVGTGLVFLVVALIVLLGGGDGLVRNGSWLAPAALIALGALGVATARPRGGNGH